MMKIMKVEMMVEMMMIMMMMRVIIFPCLALGTVCFFTALKVEQLYSHDEFLSLSELHGSPYSIGGGMGVSGKPLPPLRQVPLCLFICNNQMAFQIVSPIACCINTVL